MASIIPRLPRVPILIVNGAPAAFTSGNPIIFPNVIKDTGFQYSPLTGNAIAPYTGIYRISGMVFTNATNPLLIALVQAAAQYPALGIMNTSLGSPAGSTLISAVAGQTIALSIESGTSGSIGGGNYNGMCIEFVSHK